jgi:hypothetical protein
MSNDASLIEHLRYHASDLGAHAVPCREAADQIERLEVALQFYRDGWMFQTHKSMPGLSWSPKEELLDDCGNIARAALGKDTGK